MSDELKPESQAPETENSELSGKDMEEVVAGAAIVSDPDEGGDVQVVSEHTNETKGIVTVKRNIATGVA